MIPAKIGFKLNKKDKLITGDNSRAQVVFSDNTIISLGNNSKIDVEEYVYEVGHKPKATFKFGGGIFKSISGKISKLNPTKYKLKTKSASIGIRGTIVGLDLNKDREIYMVLEGKIEVSNDTKKTIVREGRQFTYKDGVAQRVEKIRTKTKDKLERESGARDNERESGVGVKTQTKEVNSSEKCNYR